MEDATDAIVFGPVAYTGCPEVIPGEEVESPSHERVGFEKEKGNEAVSPLRGELFVIESEPPTTEPVPDKVIPVPFVGLDVATPYAEPAPFAEYTSRLLSEIGELVASPDEPPEGVEQVNTPAAVAALKNCPVVQVLAVISE